jgi:hypothetical protein
MRSRRHRQPIICVSHKARTRGQLALCRLALLLQAAQIPGMSESEPSEGGNGDRDQSLKVPAPAPPKPTPKPASAEPSRPDATPDAALLAIKSSLNEISGRLKLKFWKVTIADLINFVMLALVGGTLWTARDQFRTAQQQSAMTRDQLTYTILLQLKRDSEELTEFLASKSPALRRMDALSCDIPDGSQQAQGAERETNHVLDFYEFYYMARYDYDLIRQNNWDQLCTGAQDLIAGNCFTRKNADRIIGKRANAGFRQTMSACVATK